MDGVLEQQFDKIGEKNSENQNLKSLRMIQTGMLTSHRANADRDLHMLNLARFYTTPSKILLKPSIGNSRRVGLSPRAMGAVGVLLGLLLGAGAAFIGGRQAD